MSEPSAAATVAAIEALAGADGGTVRPYQVEAVAVAMDAFAAREVERRREAEAALDDMIVSAVRYCIGRQSYIVGSCDRWLRQWWPRLKAGTRDVVLKDIQTALEQERLGRRQLGLQIDIDTWAALYRDFMPGGKDYAPVDRQGGSPDE